MVNGKLTQTVRHGQDGGDADQVSDGRLNLGLAPDGSSSSIEFGIDFKTIPGRLAGARRSLQIIKGMFEQGKTTCTAPHNVIDAVCNSQAEFRKRIHR